MTTLLQELDKVLAKIERNDTSYSTGLAEGELERAITPQAASMIRAALELQAKVEAGDCVVHWTKTKPSRSGVYGVRGYELGVPKHLQFEAAVLVHYDESGELRCNIHSKTTDENIEDWSYVSDMNNDFEWCVFMPAPPAGEQDA